MRRLLPVALLLASVGAAFVAGVWHARVEHASAEERPAPAHTRYACPMHPHVRSDRPGVAPCCGMDLEPVSADAVSHTVAAAGALALTTDQQRIIGVRVEPVALAPVTHALRLFGRVALDERRSYTLNAGIEGTILEAGAATTGSIVRKHELLATYTAPELLMAMQSYILAVQALDRRAPVAPEATSDASDDVGPVISTKAGELVVNSTNSNFRQRVDRLQFLGMSDLQMAEMRRTREVPNAIKILAPADGVVLTRTVSPGMKFGRGDAWFRIADLRRVWVVADVLGADADAVAPGAGVTVRLPGRAVSLAARVTDVLPQYDATTRTLTVRIEVANSDLLLRPDMAVDVEVALESPPAITVPAEALLDSGTHRSVFVERNAGVFERRGVTTGWRRGGRVQILEGLAAGERVVTAGTFLLDSESRMRAAAQAGGGTHAGVAGAAHPAPAAGVRPVGHPPAVQP